MSIKLYALAKWIVAGWLSVSLIGCSTDPMEQKYTDAEGIQPLLSDKIKPPIDERILEYVMDAKMTNERNGVPNEGKTFNELAEQGIHLYAVRKSVEITDSIAYKVEVEQRLKQK